MNIIVRSPTHAEIPQAAAILHHSWTTVFSQWIPLPQIEKVTLERCVGAWESIIEGSGGTKNGLGAFDDDRLRGTVVWGQPREDSSFDAELVSMLIDEKSFRLGIGRKLFNQTRLDMKNLGARNFYLNCIEENHQALEFYKAMGGRLLPEKLKRDGYNELRMAWEF